MTALMEQALELATLHVEQVLHGTIEPAVLAQEEHTLVWTEPDGSIVFCRVFARSTDAFGHPFEALSTQKLAALRRWAAQWMISNSRAGHIRIDAMAIALQPGGKPVLEHLQRVM